MTGNPMVTLNRAVSAAMVDGPAAGLALLDGLDERAGAVAHYQAAAGRTTSVAERDYLLLRAARLLAA